MNNKAANVIIFVAGAAIGSVVTWKYTKTKYEKIAQEEIDSVKKVFSKREAALNDEIEEAHSHLMENETRESDIAKRYADVLAKHQHVNYSEISKPKKEEEEDKETDAPYIITPEEFGEYEDYEQISITYYADGVLADDDEEIIEDVEEVIGFDSLTQFGEYEEDVVFVRNDRLKSDYEISRDLRTYQDAIGITAYGSD